ncbi:unnamed protein product [Diamesa serratosioi]
MAFLRSNKLFRFVGAARNFVFNATREYEGNLVQHTQCLCNAQGFATIAKPNQTLESSLKRLDQDVRRSGRISRRDLEEILEEIRSNKAATSSQSLLVIRCCGNLVPEELPETRTSLVQEIWKTLDNLNVPMDISHYNALLRVYLENEHQFSPTEFLADLQSKGVEPNRVTYQRLISRYCQQGDIDGATQILEFMREKQLPVNENVFNALIMGHSFADDMESAAGIIAVMSQAGLDPSADTYTTLLCGYARKGDVESINKTIDTCEQKDIYLLDKDLLEVIYAMALNGHSAKVDEVLNKIKRQAGYNQDAVNVILRLINKGHEETALKILKTMPRGTRTDGELTDTGNFLIKQLVKANRPLEMIMEVCKDLEAEKMNSRPLLVAVEAALAYGMIDLATPLLKEMQKASYEIRQHYFWPLICAGKNQQEVIDVLKMMQNEFSMSASGETVREYVIPNMKENDFEKLITMLRNVGVSLATTSASTAYIALLGNDLKKAAEIVTTYSAYYSPGLFRRPLLGALAKTKDYESYIKIIRQINDNIPRLQNLNTNQKRETIQEDVEEVDSEAVAIISNANNTQAAAADILGQIVLDASIHFKSNRAEVVQKILEGLVEQGLSISSGKAEKIQERIGEELNSEISTLLGKLTTGELEPVPIEKTRSRAGGVATMDVESLERLIAKLEEKGDNTKGLKRQLLVTSIRNKDIVKTEEIITRLEAEGYKLTSGVYAQLIDLYSAFDKLDEAVLTYKKIIEKEPEFILDDTKTIKLAQLYANADRFEDAVKFLESNKKDAVPDERGFNYNTTCWRLLNSIAEKGKTKEVQMLFDALLVHNYIIPNNILLGPLIKVHIVNDEIKAAVDKFEEICQKYKSTPWKNEIACRLIQTEDAQNLQRITDLSTEIHGEVNSLYDLVFSFVECGRVRQARKILETPGLRTRPQRISSACERYLQEGMIQPLEGLMEATKDLSHIDRAEIYSSLLKTYIKEVAPEKALGLWTKMQEEDITPSDVFLANLSQFLKSQKLDVPFVVPDKVPTQKRTNVEKKEKTMVSEAIANLKAALKEENIDAIMKANANLSPSDKLSLTEQSLVIEALIKNDRLQEGTKLVLEMLEQQKTHPIPRIFRFYLNKLAAAGDAVTLEKIGTLISSETKKVLSFDNRCCHANIAAGKSEEYLKKLESAIDNATSEEQIKEVGEKFPRGGAVGILEAMPESAEQFEQLALKYAAKGQLGPMNVLWSFHFINNNKETADRLWNEHLVSAPRLMFQRIVHLGRDNQDHALVQRLIDLLRNAKVSEGAIGNAYSCLLDIYSNKNDADACLKTLEISIKDVCLENINRTALMRVKECVEKAGKKFPHEIPNKAPKNTKAENSSSSSSSSSDDEVDRKKKKD